MTLQHAANDTQPTKADYIPRLRPRVHPQIAAFLQNREQLFGLVECYGSPLNLVFPQNVSGNISEFQAVYKRHHLRGRIYFTSKPCKSLALYRHAAGEDIGIDVSSDGSLDAALRCGWNSSRIGATGPKNKSYLSSVLKNDILLNVDNIEELKQAATLHAALDMDRKIRITLRLADCGNGRVNFLTQDDTTFGIRTSDIDFVLSYIKEHDDIFDFLGFSYHASMASDEQRIAAMENQLSLTFAAVKKGLKPSLVNIGGGFPIMYADSCRDWADYTHAIKESVLGRMPSQTWNNNGLGYRMENGAIRGGAMYINHAPVHTKGEELDRWLSFRLPSYGNAAFADLVRDSLLSLSIEPGRGMLDQCGVTIGRVAFTKRSAGGERLIGLEMNRSNIHSNHFKQLTEPVVIPSGQGQENIACEGVYYVGNLCLSFDMLQYNKTYPDYLPQADDLIVFANTAAYMMDFTESETLMQPIAKKIAITQQGQDWAICPDEDYRRLS